MSSLGFSERIEKTFHTNAKVAEWFVIIKGGDHKELKWYAENEQGKDIWHELVLEYDLHLSDGDGSSEDYDYAFKEIYLKTMYRKGLKYNTSFLLNEDLLGVGEDCSYAVAQYITKAKTPLPIKTKYELINFLNKIELVSPPSDEDRKSVV